MKAVSSRYSEYQICVGTAISLTCCFALYSVVSGVWALGLLCIPMVAVNTIFQLVNSAQIARAAPQELKGTLVAVDMVRVCTWVNGRQALHTCAYAALKHRVVQPRRHMQCQRRSTERTLAFITWMLYVVATQAIFSSMRIWTPAFGTFILSTFGYWSIGAVSSFSSALIVLLLAVS